MFNIYKKITTIYNELHGWKKTSRQLGIELVETQAKFKEAENKIVILELALAELKELKTASDKTELRHDLFVVKH